jgi:thiol-disulfide isomerase/thioredoxin
VLRSGAELPSFEGATRWINQPISADELRGHPVFVQFWAMSCHLCKENQPTVRQWRADYAPRGVTFIAVHMPRQASDTSEAEVEATARAYEIDEPLAVDNDHVLGDRFQTDGLWPVYFLFDAEGKLRARAAGAAGLGVLSAALERIATSSPGA